MAAEQSERRPREFVSQSLINISLFFWAVIVILPLVWLLYSSFKTDQEIFFAPWALPQTLQWENFERAWVAVHIGQYFLNSMKVVIPSLALTLALASMTSYVLARFQFFGNRTLFYLFMAGMLFPIFMALVPLFFLAKDLQLLNTFTGLTLVYTAYSLPFTIFFLTGFFKTLPSELHEAALIDGANEYQVFFRVMLPLAQPGLVTMAIFNFLGMWNQFILPLVLMTERDNYVLPQGLSFILHQQYYKTDWSALFAALSIIMIPTLLVYAVFQNQIQKGVTVGALKG
ncbi:MAG: carbohydrate ABC transporter permease [Chloroflexi bacterium]|nr:carbohydrate ABC transporter permease [Chloroflexota bacterium]